MKVKLILPAEKVSNEGADGHAVVVSTYTEREFEIEDRGGVEFTTSVNETLENFSGKVLVNPNHITALEFVEDGNGA